MDQQRQPRAFISCSLRQEDKQFVDLVVAITRRFGFQPTGTVGRYRAAPRPIWEQMRDEIQSADCIVLAATPRYIQLDINDRNRTGRGISEMLHVEVGMAVATRRPILAFVLEGTDVGSFLPQTVQYIVLQPNDRVDLQTKWPLIANYFRSSFAIIQERWRQENRNDLLKLGGVILATIGAATIIDSIFGDKSEQ
jgi:hypothetical protein